MKTIYNYFLPVPGFRAIMLFGVIFARKSAYPLSGFEINHEAIHKAQAIDDFKKDGENRNFRAYCRFYWAYLHQWIKYRYRNCPFEREAYNNALNLNYLKTRKRHAWRDYLKL